MSKPAQRRWKAFNHSSVGWPLLQAKRPRNRSWLLLTNSSSKKAKELGRKLYPATKGFIKGQLESFAQDPDRKEIGKKIFDTSRELSKDVVAPFGDKLEEQSQAVLRELDQTLQGVKKLRNDNKDLIEGLASGIETILKALKQAAPPPQKEGGAP